jgi:hypothetical protein
LIGRDIQAFRAADTPDEFLDDLTRLAAATKSSGMVICGPTSMRFGAEDGREDWPVIVLALSIARHRNMTRGLVVAVTHTPPIDSADAVRFRQRPRA